MQRATIRPTGPGAPTSVPSPGAVSSVGPRPPAVAKPKKNTRDYGKNMAAPTAPSPAVFGSATPGGLVDV